MFHIALIFTHITIFIVSFLIHNPYNNFFGFSESIKVSWLWFLIYILAVWMKKRVEGVCQTLRSWNLTEVFPRIIFFFFSTLQTSTIFQLKKFWIFFYLGSSHFYQFFRVFNKTCKICEAKRRRITPEDSKHYMIQQYEELMVDPIGQFKMSSYIAVNISAILTIDQ